jgi:hypothetical protein
MLNFPSFFFDYTNLHSRSQKNLRDLKVTFSSKFKLNFKKHKNFLNSQKKFEFHYFLKHTKKTNLKIQKTITKIKKKFKTARTSYKISNPKIPLNDQRKIKEYHKKPLGSKGILFTTIFSGRSVKTD